MGNRSFWEPDHKVVRERSAVGLFPPYLTRCWGCGFTEDENGSIAHPKRIVTSANKVDKLYMIKRQLLDHIDTYRVNLVEPKEDLVPWEQLIYVADGANYVPAF